MELVIARAVRDAVRGEQDLVTRTKPYPQDIHGHRAVGAEKPQGAVRPGWLGAVEAVASEKFGQGMVAGHSLDGAAPLPVDPAVPHVGHIAAPGQEPAHAEGGSGADVAAVLGRGMEQFLVGGEHRFPQQMFGPQGRETKQGLRIGEMLVEGAQGLAGGEQTGPKTTHAIRDRDEQTVPGSVREVGTSRHSLDQMGIFIGRAN